MARVTFVLDDKLDARFRTAVFHKLGMKKGNLQIALEEAVEDWLSKSKVASK